MTLSDVNVSKPKQNFRVVVQISNKKNFLHFSCKVGILFISSMVCLLTQNKLIFYKRLSYFSNLAKKSTNKCGAVLLAFPEADKNGIVPSCTSTKCYFSKPGVAKLEPSMVKCAGSRWKLGTNEVISDPKSMTFEMVTFNDFDLDIDCKGQSFWESVQDYYQPHPLEEKYKGIANIQQPRVLCEQRGRSKWCAWHCLKKDGTVKRTGRQFKCHAKKVKS